MGIRLCPTAAPPNPAAAPPNPAAAPPNPVTAPPSPAAAPPSPVTAPPSPAAAPPSPAAAPPSPVTAPPNPVTAPLGPATAPPSPATALPNPPPPLTQPPHPPCISGICGGFSEFSHHTTSGCGLVRSQKKVSGDAFLGYRAAIGHARSCRPTVNGSPGGLGATPEVGGGIRVWKKRCKREDRGRGYYLERASDCFTKSSPSHSASFLTMAASFSACCFSLRSFCMRTSSVWVVK